MRRFIFSLALVAALCGPSKGQIQSMSLPSIGESSVVVINKGDINISFALRPKDGVWSNYKIDSGSNMRISCDQCSTPSFEIYVSTKGDKVANYMLGSDGRYSIEWNSAEQKWDVYKIE